MQASFDILGAALWGVAAAGMAWYIGTVAQQITYVTLADGRQQERRLPLLYRLLLPLAPNLVPLFSGPGMTRRRVRTDRAIVSAGFEGLLSAEEHLAMFLLCPIVLGPIWIVMMRGAIAYAPFLAGMEMGLDVLALTYLACFPSLWLSRERRMRHRQIQRALPFVLDLLTLSVEAGMDFMTSLQRNVDRRKLDALGEELIRVIREIQLGKTRREALKAMSDRIDLPALRSVISALIQADELGVSIGTILRIQADQIRQHRFERAEALANKAPVKMLAPLLLFIFPAVFIVLLGPVLYKMAHSAAF
jgi:pilus assembly protein TadC